MKCLNCDLIIPKNKLCVERAVDKLNLAITKLPFPKTRVIIEKLSKN